MVWNVRGINNQHKQKDVLRFLNWQSVGLVDLLETKVKAHNMRELHLSLFKGWCFTSNSSLHKGVRIVLAWNLQGFHVNIKSCSSQLIHRLILPVSGLP